MPFIAKSAAPAAAHPAARHWTFDRAALGGLTAFVAPPGYLRSEGLLEALERQGRPVTWLRLGPEDHDPATFLASLAAAIRRHDPGGWAAGAERLGAELAAALPAPAALVLEHAHHLAGPGGESPAPRLLGRLLGPLLDDDRACVLTSERALPAGALPARGAVVTADDLRLGAGAAGELLAREAPELAPAAARRLATLCRGAAGDLLAVCEAAAALDPAVVERAADRAGRVEELLAQLAAAWLAAAGPNGRRALALALEVGYGHPALAAAVLGTAAAAPAGPWLQPLADGWEAVRGGWREPLAAALGPARSLGRETVHRAADVLVERGAAEQAVPLYLALEDRACAAEAAAGPTPPGSAPATGAPAVPDPAPATGPETDRPGPLLTVHLLGQLKVRLDDVEVEDWPSGRGRALFKYLVTHRDPWPRREVLMEAFWPDADPAAARNRLNVAVHGLRRALRAATQAPLVVLEGGAYRLHPGVRLWLDVDEFEGQAAAGRRLEAAGDPAGAAAAYERAVALYQGDFLADDPYEEWPVLTREQLLLTYLDVLDRLSGLWFGRHQYGACAALCRQLLQRDPCREDAHRRLMRCYARQGQPHLALRQYQACADALRQELGLEPDPATTAVARQVRQHQPV